MVAELEMPFRRDIATVSAIAVVPTILDVVCRATTMRFAAVARVTEARWIACSVRDEIDFGLVPGGELKVETTICHEIRQSGEHVVIDHVDEDATFCRHPTPQMYGFQSYISMPIRRPSGEFFGTLCAIDPRAVKLNTPETIGMFKLFADLIGFHLDAQERLQTSEAALLDERQTGELREQFIAVLGHDLRNPLSSIHAGASLLTTQPLDIAGRRAVQLMQKSVRRMAGLIDNVLDFARGRLGGGLDLKRAPDPDIEAALDHVVAELQVAWPDRTIVCQFDLQEPVSCDTPRISQLLSNLVANALTHGATDAPVTVRAKCDDGVFELSVTNTGAPIPDPDRLFQPFLREGSKAGGLGLGLFIAAEIARAHEGTLEVRSDTDETCFTLKMPTTPS